MDTEENADLLSELFEQILQVRFQYRFQWNRPGTIFLWDNRCVMHKATTKQLPANMTRTLYRVSTLGSVPC